MNTLELNIGLLVEHTMKEWDYELAKMYVNNEIHTTHLMLTKLLKGTYEGQEQSTLYVKTNVGHDLTILEWWVKRLCVILEQTCIAMVFNGIGYLIYHPRYKGEKYQFDEQYFVRP